MERAEPFQAIRQALRVRDEGVVCGKEQLLAVEDRGIAPGGVVGVADCVTAEVAGVGSEQRRKRRAEVLVEEEADAVASI